LSPSVDEARLPATLLERFDEAAGEGTLD